MCGAVRFFFEVPAISFGHPQWAGPSAASSSDARKDGNTDSLGAGLR
jgi:hypothetical protein